MNTMNARGYMLLETTVAIVVLGIVSLAIHGVTRQAVQTRAQSQDYTRVAFLMEDYIAKLEMEPKLVEGLREGVFEAEGRRFSYTCTIQPHTLPPLIINTSQDPATPTMETFSYPTDSSFLVHVALTVRWTRGTIPFEETMETLLPPEKLFIPLDVPAPATEGENE